MSEFKESISGVETVPKAKKGKIIAGVTAGVIALAGGGTLIAYNTSDLVKNKFKLATLSPEKYYAWVNDKNSTEQLGYLSDAYNKYVDIMGNGEKGLNSKINLTYTMSDGIKDLAKTTIGGDETLNAFIDNASKISINLDETLSDGILGMNLGLDFNDNDLLDFEYFMNYADLFMMARIPQLKDQYIGMDYKAYAEEYMLEEDLASFETLITFYSDPESLLTKDEFKSLTEKYTNIWNDCVTEVEQEKNEKVTVGNYTNEYTLLKVDLNNKFLSNTAEKYINEIKEDTVIKDIVVKRLAICDEATYTAELDELLEDIKSGDTEDDDFSLTLTTYVDPRGDIRGYSLLDSDNSGFECIFTGESEEKANGIFKFNDGDDTEFVVNIDYVNNKNKYTGSIDFSITEYEETQKALIEFTDIEVVNEEYGYVNGNLNISVNDSAPFALDLTSEGSSQKASFDIDINDINYGNLILEISASETDKISMPDKSSAYMIDMSYPDLSEYLTEDDIINFVSSLLKNLGIDLTEEELEYIIGSYMYDDYYYDDDYYYYDDYDYDDYDLDYDDDFYDSYVIQ